VLLDRAQQVVSTGGLSLMVLLSSACGRQGIALPTQTAEPAARVPVVAAARATLSPQNPPLALAAEFRPDLEVDLHAKLAGYLARINVDVGATVREGDTIAVLDAPELEREREQLEAAERRLETEVRRARSEISRIEADLRLRRLALERLESVARARPQLIAQQEVDVARSRVEEIQAQAAAAQANLAGAEQQIVISKAALHRVDTLFGFTRITAPFSGVITKRYADPGAMIQQGTASSTQARAIVRLARLDRLRLTVAVPERALAGVHLGREVDLEVPALGLQRKVRIARFPPALDPATRTMPVEMDVPNPGLQIKPGMSATVRFPASGPLALTAPKAAILDRSGPTVLRVGRDGKLEELRVSLGQARDGVVEILSGIEPGDILLTAYRAGQTVKPELSGNHP